MFAVVITGPPGAGKTTALMALSDALADDGIAHAAVDVDEIAWAYPYPSDARRLELLGAAWEAHRGDGQELLLVAEVGDEPAHVAHAVEAVGADDHLVVLLGARPATLRRRIEEREPPGWSGLERLIAEAGTLGAKLAGMEGVGLALDSEEHDSGEIAARIRAARPDLLGSSAP